MRLTIGLKKPEFPNWEIFGKLLLALLDEFLLKSRFSLTATQGCNQNVTENPLGS